MKQMKLLLSVWYVFSIVSAMAQSSVKADKTYQSSL